MTYIMKDGDTVKAEGPTRWLWVESNKMWSGANKSFIDAGRVLKQYSLTSIVSPVEFKARFTIAEQVAIRTARKGGNDALDIFFEMLDDPRLSEINVDSKTMEQGVDYLVAASLIEPDRKSEILAPKEIEVA